MSTAPIDAIASTDAPRAVRLIKQPTVQRLPVRRLEPLSVRHETVQAVSLAEGLARLLAQIAAEKQCGQLVLHYDSGGGVTKAEWRTFRSE